MSSRAECRGKHLVRADRSFATGGGLLARLIAPAFIRLLDRMHDRMAIGGVDVIFPDGRPRRIGFHAPGPVALVRLDSWMALVRVALSGSVGWYKAWEKGEWSSPDMVPLFALFAANAISLGNVARAKGPARWINRLAHRLRDNAPAQARDNIAAHYDLGNDFYAAWLDPGMTYSAACFGLTPSPFVFSEGRENPAGVDSPDFATFVRSEVDRHGPTVSPALVGQVRANGGGEGGSLEAAQQRKIAMLLDRLKLKPGDRLLEIGCGWGSLAIEAARRGALVVGLTLSEQQKAWADQRISACGLTDRIEIRLADYRDIDEAFDAVASVEMVEAVGERWWGAYLDCIARNLKPGRRAALQFISIDHRLWNRYEASADFIQAYIFPGGMLLDEPLFETLAKHRGLSWNDRFGFGLDYARTLRIWRVRYDSAVERGDLDGFGEPFHNLWRYYLMYSEGGFRGRLLDVAQVTLVRN